MFDEIIRRNELITAEEARNASMHMSHWINKKRKKENDRKLYIAKRVATKLIKETIFKGDTECDLIGVDDSIVPLMTEWFNSLGYTTSHRKTGFITYITISWGDNHADK